MLGGFDGWRLGRSDVLMLGRFDAWKIGVVDAGLQPAVGASVRAEIHAMKRVHERKQRGQLKK